MTARESLNMPLEEAMRTQRAIRRFRPDPVDDELVLHLIELALKAPTGSNAQNWEFVMVKDPAVKARLAALNHRAWSVYSAIGRWTATRAGDQGTLRILDAGEWLASHFQTTPVLVVACLKGFIPPWPPFATASIYGSIFPSMRALRNHLCFARVN
jgi:nitroreductase